MEIVKIEIDKYYNDESYWDIHWTGSRTNHSSNNSLFGHSYMCSICTNKDTELCDTCKFVVDDYKITFRRPDNILDDLIEAGMPKTIAEKLLKNWDSNYVDRGNKRYVFEWPTSELLESKNPQLHTQIIKKINC